MYRTIRGFRTNRHLIRDIYFSPDVGVGYPAVGTPAGGRPGVR